MSFFDVPIERCAKPPNYALGLDDFPESFHNVQIQYRTKMSCRLVVLEPAKSCSQVSPHVPNCWSHEVKKSRNLQYKLDATTSETIRGIGF